MKLDLYLEPSPARADGVLQSSKLPVSSIYRPDRGSAARMPIPALNSPLRGGFSKQNSDPVAEPIPSPLRAIRAKCLDCSGGNKAEVRRCVVTQCALYPFRLGRNPNRRRAAQ
jgi:hypothetical protein